MRSPSLTLAAIATALVASPAGVFGSPAAASSPDGGLFQQQAADVSPMVDALVVMRSQADLSTIRASGRAARLGAIERALRDHSGRSQAGVLRLLETLRAQGAVSTVRRLWVKNEVEVRATPEALTRLAARGDVLDVRPNSTVQAPASLGSAGSTATVVEPNVALVHAPQMWDRGFRGQNVVVASMDTGVDGSNPELAGKWRGGTNSWYDPNGQHTSTPTDVSGHGTQTMGVIVGADAGGSSIGVAPDARWIAVKIFNDRGSATLARIHQGYQWLLDPDGNQATPDAPNVVNNSWATGSTACDLEFQPDLLALRAARILPVFAAGNYGPSPGSVLSPANLAPAFAVGGVDNSLAMDPGSGRGPSTCQGSVAPKLVAPDTGVRTTDLYGGYTSVTGTSVAAPHVTGAAALLLSAYPGLTADQQEAGLESGALDLGVPGLDNDFGFGGLDAATAYDWVSTTPDFTVSAAPASATTTPGGTATYTISTTTMNGFSGDVALSLTGLPSSVGSGTFAPATITGAGNSQLTVTTSSTAPTGSYPMTITGSSGATTRTASATLVVTPPPDFTMSVTPASQSVTAGSAATYAVATAATNGFTGNVQLSLTGLPAAVGTAAFTPSSVAAGAGAQLVVSTLASAPPGSYALTVTGTSAGLTHTAPATLVVAAQQDFSISASPSQLSINRGGTASYTVSVQPIGGATGSVTLSVSGAPTGATATFTSNPVNLPGGSTLRVRTYLTTARGTYTIRVTGQKGTITHQATVTLVVR